MLPHYAEVEVALLDELRRRGGKARPRDRDRQGRTIYEALADHFHLTSEDLAASTHENGVARSKWENMVRWARRKLVERGELVAGQHGIWQVNHRVDDT